MENFTVYSSLCILSVVPVMEMELVYNDVQADKGETRKACRISQGNFLKSVLRFYIKSLNVILNLSVWSY
jgi:hypothetical protein